jgi:peptidoglycan/LPS O-acetylase OafA/YrhL
VVFDHLTYSVFQPVRDSVYHWSDPGQYGVFVFFLVSGYIVPASLERRGSVRGFWVSRVFRLYPLYLFALSAMIVLWASGIGSLGGMDSDAVTSSFADVFMLQSVLWGATVPNVVWSLADAGGPGPDAHRGRRARGADRAAADRVQQRLRGALGDLHHLRADVHRHHAVPRRGRPVPWRRALYVSVLVFGLTLVAVQWHVSPLAENDLAIRKTFNTLELAGLTFAVAMLCRHKKVPHALAWLGLVSYSLYLLHPVLIEVYDSVPWTRNQNFVPTELLLVAVFLLVLLVCCGLTHRLIEAPMQRLGRRVTRRLDVRFGPDTVATQPDGVAPAATQ